METQSIRRPISQGTCVFCKAELAKNKMTQHLKFCKQRLATLATQEQQSQEMKTRLFHILAEGQYNPQYWLHFEVPASEPLWSLDDFLKDMWIDDLDHLSGFTINGTNYSTDYPDDFFFFSEEEKTEEEDRRAEDHITSLEGGPARCQFSRTGPICFARSAQLSPCGKPLSSKCHVLSRQQPSTYEQVRLGLPPPSGLVWLATWPSTSARPMNHWAKVASGSRAKRSVVPAAQRVTHTVAPSVSRRTAPSLSVR